MAVPKRADRRNGPKTVAPISAGEPEDEGPVVENQVVCLDFPPTLGSLTIAD